MMKGLRPISLCTVLYKIVSKIMVNWLKPFLPHIISSTQSAFVSERLISDNILVAHEMVHGLKTYKDISAEFFALKTDMSKAYDCVEWKFLRSLMQAMGFDHRWIRWIMACVNSVTYSVLVNGQSHGFIQPKRGLRQGDPLSPFLFVMCTKTLIHLLQKSERDNKLCGVKFSEEGPMVHHILFADDILFTCRATNEQCEELLRCLQQYGMISGQLINLEKSSITFGERVPEATRVRLKTKLRIYNEGGVGMYLGLPECFSGSKQKLLGYIRDRLHKRLNRWYAKHLSQGGKEVLIKSVALALLVYAMSCFRFTKDLCKKMTSAICDLWWNSEKNKRKIHWISWDKLFLEKEIGGLGFRDVERFNQALLAKQAWRIYQVKDSLFARVFKSRYFLNGEFLTANMGDRPSYAWRSIHFGRELLTKGLKKVTGSGDDTFVWRDRWIDNQNLQAPSATGGVTDLGRKVRALIEPNTGEWCKTCLQNLFVAEDIAYILRDKPSLRMKDRYVWSLNKNGYYYVKSGY